MRVKIFGAGSIGNHLAQASRQAGWEVIVADVDPKALERMKNELYPKRYGAWDEAIQLCAADDAPKGGFDAIFVGTPPDHHLPIATRVLRQEPPRVLQIEKPLCSPTLAGLDEFMQEAKAHPETMVVMGFNHILAANTLKTEELIRQNMLGKAQSLNCEIRSHWKNIFDAHPWLSGPQDTYLGYWRRGGGAGGEHIHALNLWQHLSHVIGGGRIKEVSALFDYVKENGAEYDRSCYLNLVTETGLVGRVAQDVVMLPKQKFAHIQFEGGSIGWFNDVTKTTDQVVYQEHKKDPQVFDIAKSRTEEFFKEIEHIGELLEGKIKISASPIRLERGVDSMLVLAAAHKSYQERRTVQVEYSW